MSSRLVLAALLSVPLAPALAQQAAQPLQVPTTPILEPPVSRGTLSLSFENDLFGGTDRYYTAGWQVAWRSPGYEPPPVIRWLTDLGLLLLPAGGTPRWGAAFGQNIFTSGDTQVRNPDPNDRPYAGWLYGALTVSAFTARTYGAMELQVGVVGPSALGEQTQNNLHDFLNIDRALGWDYQLKDELGVNVIWTRLWRHNWKLDSVRPGLEYGVVPGATISVGNVETYASVGGVARIGENLDADFGPPRIRPALAGSGYFYPADTWGYYAFAGAEGRLVAHDIFLDGNTFRDSRSVDKENYVADLTLGAALIIPWGRLSYTHVFRSPQFKTQNDWLQFGSIALSVRF